MGCAKGCACEGSHDNAGDELRGDFAAGGLGELVVDELADFADGEDPARDGVAHEVKGCASKREPAKTCSPTDDGWGHEGAKAGDDADEEGEDEDQETSWLNQCH